LRTAMAAYNTGCWGQGRREAGTTRRPALLLLRFQELRYCHPNQS
jgi:hypothetical protein